MCLLAHWLEKTVLGVLAIAACIFICGCGAEPEDGSEKVSRFIPTPGMEADVIPCGPPYWESGSAMSLFPSSDLFLEWTPDGSKLMFSHGSAIMIIDSDGTQLRMLVDAYPRGILRYGFHADISPDGTQIVFSACKYPWELQFLRAKRSNALLSLPVDSPDDYDVALISIDGGEPQRLTDNPFLDHFPAWSSDGTRIAYIASIDKGKNSPTGKAIFTMAADGSDILEVGTTHYRAVAAAPLVWSPDGEQLALLMNEGKTRRGFFPKNLYTVRPNGREFMMLAEDVVSVASWSPDGQRLAVAKYADEDIGLFTLAADGTDLRLIVSITSREAFEAWNGSYQFLIRTVLWSPDGRQILYSCDLGMCVVDADGGEVLGLLKGLTEWEDEVYVAAWSPDSSQIAIYIQSRPIFPEYIIPARLYLMNRDGTNPHRLLRLNDDKDLVPANPPH